jgi:hypothetical protein
MKQLIAYIVVLAAVCACSSQGRHAAMRSALDSINQRNRNDQPFTPVDVEPYVSYFDRHGTGNDRLLAHYLLGRAYHEQGEAPMALQCYQEAITAADTASKDCDFAQLSRVYGQTCEVFYYQGLYQDELRYRDSAIRYAWLGKDTLSALLNYEQKAHTYKNLQNSDSVIMICENASLLYKKFGYHKYAASVLGSCLREVIEKGDYLKAKQYMDVYENESGFFNQYHQIESGREIYYNIKGLFFLNTGKVDSAEYFFRKELYYGKDCNNQNAASKGLAEVYKRKHNSDSIAKYAMYSYAMNDSLYKLRTTDDILRIQSIYNYSRFQELARSESEKALHRAVLIKYCFICLILLSLITYIIISSLIRKRQEIEQKYMQSLEIIQHTRADIEKLSVYKEENKELIFEKEDIINKQLAVQQELREKSYNSVQLADKALKSSSIYHLFESMSIRGALPETKEWEQLEETLFMIYPGFHQFMKEHQYLLNDKEFKTCMLLRIDIKPKSISNMLNVDPSYISNIRTEMLNKLFSISGKPKEFDKLIKGML